MSKLGKYRGCVSLLQSINHQSCGKNYFLNIYVVLMMGVLQEKLRVGYLADRSPESIKTIIPFLINGVSLLAITAPALQKLLEESQDVINFDRCCHLVFEDAEVLLKNHYSAICEIIRRYQLSVQRTKSNPNHVHMPRQARITLFFLQLNFIFILSV